MLLSIAAKELRESLFSLRFGVTMIVVLVLVSAIVFSLSADYRKQVDDYNKRVELHKRAAATYAAGREGLIDRPVPSLSSLFVGLSTISPNQIALQEAEAPELKQVAEIGATDVLFPSIDLGFCLGVVLSLAALLFSYDLITGEKESGSLRQMLSNPVSRASILLGKWMAVFATLSIATILTIGYALLLSKALPGSAFSLRSSDLASLGLILFTSLIYLSAFSLLGIFVSSLVSKSATSLAILMLVWVMAVFVIPNVSPYVAVSITPATTYQEEARKEKIVDSEMTNQLKTRHQQGAQRVRDEKMNSKQMQEVYDSITDPWTREHKIAIEGMKTDYRNRMTQQEQTGTRLTSISPYGSFLFALTALTETGVQSDERFLQAARLYEQDQLIPYTQALKQAKDKKSIALPNFAVQPTPLSQRLAATSLEMMILLGYNLGLFAAAYVAFLRYDVR